MAKKKSNAVKKTVTKQKGLTDAQRKLRSEFTCLQILEGLFNQLGKPVEEFVPNDWSALSAALSDIGGYNMTVQNIHNAVRQFSKEERVPVTK